MMGLNSQSGLLSQPYPALAHESRQYKRSFVSSRHPQKPNRNRTRRRMPIQSKYDSRHEQAIRFASVRFLS